MNKRILSRFFLSFAFGVTTSIASQSFAAKPTAKEAKIGTYVEILNTESNPVFENQNRYTHWVADLKTGPTCKEKKQSPLSATGDSAPEQYKHYRAAIKKGPKLEADGAALQMVEALEELRKPVIDASEYYYSHKHMDDGCKLGKELHPILLAGWEKYAHADAIVRSFVEKYNDDRDFDEVAKAEKKFGKRLHYYHRKLTLDAKWLVREIEALARHPKLDLVPVRDKLSIFDETLKDTKHWCKRKKPEKMRMLFIRAGMNSS